MCSLEAYPYKIQLIELRILIRKRKNDVCLLNDYSH